MAKKHDDRSDLPDTEIDEMDLFPDDFDIDFDTGGVNKNAKDRKPVEAIKEGIKSGAKNTITSRQELKTAIEKALPKEAGKINDNISDYLYGLSEITNDTVNQVKGDINKIRQSVAKAMPLVEKSFGNSAITNLLKKIAKNKEKEDEYNRRDEENKRIDGEIAEFTRLQAEMIKQQQASDLLRNEADRKRFESQQDLLYAIKQSSEGINLFHNRLTHRYYQKSIELNYRQLLIQHKLQSMLNESMQHQKTALDSIVKNTALPDIVKRNNNELLKDIGLRRVMNFATDSMQSYASGFKDKLIGNIGNYIKDLRNGISDSIDMFTSQSDMAMDMVGSMEDMFGEIDSRESAGRKAGELITRKMVSVLAKAGFNRLDRKGNTTAAFKKLYGNVKFAPERLNRLAKSGYTGSYFLDMLSQFVPTTEISEKSHHLSAMRALNKPAEFDNATRKSIVDIIPGLLSRIHLSVDSIRKHFHVESDERNLLEWDHDRGRFSRREDIDASVKMEYEKKLDFKSVASYTSRIVSEIDPDFSLSKTQRTLLAREIMSRLAKREGFKPEDLLSDDDRWTTDVPYNMKETLKSHIASTLYMKVGDMGGYELDKEAYNKLSRQQKIKLADKQLRIQESFRRASDVYGVLPDALANRSLLTDTEIERQVRLGYATMNNGFYRTKGLNAWDNYIQDGKQYQAFNNVATHRRNLEFISSGIDTVQLTYKRFKEEIDFDPKGGDEKYPGTVPSLNKWFYGGRPRWTYSQWVEYKTNEQRREFRMENGDYSKYGERLSTGLRYLGNKVLGEERTQQYADELNTLRGKIMGDEYHHDIFKRSLGNLNTKLKDSKSLHGVRGSLSNLSDISSKSVSELKQAVDEGRLKATEVVDKVRESAYLQTAEEVVSNTKLSVEEKATVINELIKTTSTEKWESVNADERIAKLKQQLASVRDTVKTLHESKTKAIKDGIKQGKQRAMDLYAKTTSDASREFNRFTNSISEKTNDISAKSLLSAINEVFDNTALTLSEKKASIEELLKQAKGMVSKNTLSSYHFIQIQAGVKAATNTLEESYKRIRKVKGKSSPQVDLAGSKILHQKGRGRGGARNRSYRVHRTPTLASEYLAMQGDDPDPDDAARLGFYDKVKDYVTENSKYADSFVPNTVKNAYSEFVERNKQAKEDRIVYDIYVKGEVEPRLLASKLRRGEYHIEGRDEPVVYLEDITGPVYNQSGEVVITTEDIEKGLTNFKGEEQDSYTKSRARRHYETAKKGISTALDPFVWLARGVTKLPRMSMGATNCYLKDDLRNPVLTRWGFLSYQYRDEKGNPITRVQDIRGAVYDRNGELILSEEQLKEGLVDSKGRPVRGYLIRRLRVTGDILKAMTKPVTWGVKRIGVPVAKYLLDRTKRTTKLAGNTVFANYKLADETEIDEDGNVISARPGMITRGKRGLAKVGGYFTGSSSPRGSRVRTIDGVVVDERTGKKRANNYKDDMVAQDKSTEERMRRYQETLKEKQKAKGEKKESIWEMVKNFLPNIIKLLTGGLGIMGALELGLGKLVGLASTIGKGIWSLGSLALRGVGAVGKGIGKAWKWGKDIVTGGKAATTAAKTTTKVATQTAGKTAAKATASAATQKLAANASKKAAIAGGKYVAKKAASRAGIMAAGSLIGPVGLGIASAVITALTVWDIISFVGYWVNSPGEVDNFRLAAYGVNPENEEQAEAMLGFEKWMTEKTKISDSGEVILPSLKDKDLEKTLITFMGGKSGGEYLSDNPEAKEEWGKHWESWYYERFQPTFSRHLVALHRIDKEIKLFDAFGYYTGDLKNGLVLPWLRSAYFKPTDLDNPYEQNDNPFLFVPGRDDESLYINVNNEVVKSYYDIVEKKYRNDEKNLRAKDANKKAIAKQKGQTYQSEFAFEEKPDAIGLREINQAKGEMYRSTYDLRNQKTVLNKDGSRATVEMLGNTLYVHSDINEVDLKGRSVISDIDAIRMRLYGLTNLTDTRVTPLLRLEQYVLPYLKLSSSGKMGFEGLDIGQIVKRFAPDLEWDSSSPSDVADFKLWFEYRFAPVFLNFATLLYQVRPMKDIFSIIDKLDETDLYNVALELSKTMVYIKDMEVSVWDIEYSPVKGLPANTFSGSVTSNLQSISVSTEAKVLTEKDPRGEGYRAKIAEERKLAENKDGSVDPVKGNGNAGVKKDESFMAKLFGYTTGNTGQTSSGNSSYGMGYGATNPTAGNLPNIPYNPKTTTEMQKETAKALGQETQRLGWSETEKAMFFGQVDHESNSLKTLEEDGRYKLNTLQTMFSRGRRDPEGARQAHAKGRAGIFEFIYGGRMGNDSPGDGAKYPGRGPIQITGKDNYRMVARRTGIDAVNNPTLLSTDPIAAAKSSIAWWEEKKATSKAFRDAIASRNVEGVSKAVNGGTNGLADRKAKTSAYLAGNGPIQKMMGDVGETTAENALNESSAQQGGYDWRNDPKYANLEKATINNDTMAGSDNQPLSHLKTDNGLRETSMSGQPVTNTGFDSTKVTPGNTLISVLESPVSERDDELANQGKMEVSGQPHPRMVKAASFATRRALQSSAGKCARYVREALMDAEGGGFPQPEKPVGSAYMYHTNGVLKDWGFKLVGRTNRFKPIVGDIRVWGGFGRHQHGHIHIWNGTNWISDFKESNPLGCGESYRQKARDDKNYNQSDVNIYRYAAAFSEADSAQMPQMGLPGVKQPIDAPHSELIQNEATQSPTGTMSPPPVSMSEIGVPTSGLPMHDVGPQSSGATNPISLDTHVQMSYQDKKLQIAEAQQQQAIKLHKASFDNMSTILKEQLQIQTEIKEGIMRLNELVSNGNSLGGKGGLPTQPNTRGSGGSSPLANKSEVVNFNIGN